MLFVVRGNNRNNIAALQLARQTVCKRADCNRDGLLAAVKVIEIGVISRRYIREFGVDNIIAYSKVSRSIFAYGIGLLM